MEVEIGQIVSLAQELIRVPSLSGQEHEVAELVRKRMIDLAYDEVGVDECGNVVGTIHGHRDAGSGKRLLFDGHLDTVAPVEPEEWTVDPFSGKLGQGRLYGLGALDMKGTVAAMIIAAASLPRDEISGTVLVSASVGEEVSEGAALASVIEATEPDYVVIGEPSDFRLGVAQRGRAGIVLETIGRASHSAKPTLGENAVYKMADVIYRLREMDFPRDARLGEGSMELIELISSPYPSTSIIPSRCRARYDRRLVESETPETVIMDIKEQLQDMPGVDVCLKEATLVCYTGYDLTGVDFHPAWSIPDDSELATKARRALREIEMDPNPTALEYCTNGSYSAGIAGIPTIVYGPPSISLAHAIDEYVEIQDLNRAAICFQALARALLQGEDARQ